MALLSPIIAIALTVVTGFFIFPAIGVDPFEALYVYFIEPLTAWWTVEELLIKAAPIILIAIGLSLCYRSNTWNIGAEGQLVAGAIAGSIFPILVPEWNGPLVLPVMLLMGIAGGMLYAAIPALLKIRFGTNEILTSLMLVYVAQLFLDWLARGPWRNPEGHNFPDSRAFDGWQVLPVVFGDDVRLNAIFVLIAVAVAWFVLTRTMTGFQISVLGQAPRAAAFAGFSQKRMVLLTFLISGGLAGLAGICEVAGSDRDAADVGLARLRLHRDHRRLPRPAESGRHSLRRPAAGAVLHGRRGHPDRARRLGPDHPRLPGHAALLRADLRHLHFLPRAVRAGAAVGAQAAGEATPWKGLRGRS